MIDLTIAQIADIVGGELADISPRQAATTRVTGTVAVLAARPVGVPAIIVKPHPTDRSDAGQTGVASVLEHDTEGSGAAVLAALARLANAVAAELVAGGLTIVGITGSSGKTSTKDLVAAVLAPLGEVVAPPGSFNNELGHPWTVLRATESTDYLILELSAPRTWASSAPAMRSPQRKPNYPKLFRRPE